MSDVDRRHPGYCIVCYSPMVVRAHWPKHRGSGGRFDDDWDPRNTIDLCPRCHDIIDRRHGTSAYADGLRDLALSAIKNTIRDQEGG